MDLNRAFDELQTEVNVKDRADEKARMRRDLFRDAFHPEADVSRVFPSGSLARGSQIDPIHDVDIVIVFDEADHPAWGEPGDSAETALDEVRDRVRALLGQREGTVAREVRRVDIKNHSLKCFLDDPEIENAFTVDVVPALAYSGHLLIPEARSEKWVESDPEFLIERVLGRHAAWNVFVPLIRVLKRWNKDSGAGLKSLAVEVLALNLLQEDTRPRALHQFFTAAHARIHEPILDPAGLCGEIDPKMDVDLAEEKLDEAASNSWYAVEAQDRGETDKAACHWRNVFGTIFPEPEGGCPKSDGAAGALGGFAIGTGVSDDKPRRVVDAPQG
jgi:hypothetical protein